VTVGPPETEPGGSAYRPEVTEAAGMKPLPQTQAKATHEAMTITQVPRSEGNRGSGCSSSRVPARERSSRVPADQTVRRRGEGGVDPNREVRGKATGVRSRLFDDADRTGQHSQEIVQYLRAEPPGPLLHRLPETATDLLTT